MLRHTHISIKMKNVEILYILIICTANIEWEIMSANLEKMLIFPIENHKKKKHERNYKIEIDYLSATLKESKMIWVMKTVQLSYPIYTVSTVKIYLGKRRNGVRMVLFHSYQWLFQHLCIGERFCSILAHIHRKNYLYRNGLGDMQDNLQSVPKNVR